MSGTDEGGIQDQPLGRCPSCGEMIPAANLLIRYESDGNWPKLFAECTACDDPVHPE
ncbi:hypothetical protein [Halosimplex sp. TS25]|uniref:DUF7837 family putative zinc-binding protein n=1 Tax=Halosimplex rarum TaxID=3396619 RepID=UPI0039EC17B9